MSGSSNKPLGAVGASGAGSSSPQLSNLPSAAEKNKQWQRELLMERVRSRASQLKTFPDLSKGIRMGILDKRYGIDSVEKSNLQKCLDNMQHCIKVTSRQGLVERLESLSRQLSLKFSDDGKALFISTDMFYLEILLDSDGSLTDVKVHHESKVEQQSCSELVDCLRRGDFNDFTAQLEGFSSIYQLNAESKVKIKAYDAMLAMETDLHSIFQMQNYSKDAAQALQESEVGIVFQRRGGHPMRLVYFVSPYDLISLDTKDLQPMTLEALNQKQVGFSVTVNLEASSANKLQILPTVSFSKDPLTGQDVPVFAPLTQMNSMMLPATFVLRLNKPLPVCYNTLRSMGLCSVSDPMTGPSSLESQNKTPTIANIMSLIVQTASDQQIKSAQKGLIVSLPDQTHCYYFTENKLMKSTLIHSVPYKEPSQVKKILEFLKQMALFYSLLASCVRPQSKQGIDMDTTTVMEVNAISFQQISVALQHPYEESMATIEFDLRSGVPQCSIYSISNNYDLLSIKLTKVVQKCLSIPVTIRAMLQFWDQDRTNIFQRNLNVASSGSSVSTSSGASTSGLSSSSSHASYANFNLPSISSDPSGSLARMSSTGAAMGLGTVSAKMDTTLAIVPPPRPPQMTVPSLAGFLSFKAAEAKLEDFHESPKSQGISAAGASAVDIADVLQANAAAGLQQSDLDVNSLGHLQQQLQLQQQLEQDLQYDEDDITDKYKNIWKEKTVTVKNTVSIVPIVDTSYAAAISPPLSSPLDVKRTGGIEIIPLNNPSTSMGSSGMAVGSTGSSTITITPINASGSSECKNKEKKSPVNTLGMSTSAPSSSGASSSSSGSSKRSVDSTDGQKEKKRKKKRDDSPMGPPEKIFSRQNSPAGSSDATATAVARKFSSPSSSPKGSSGGMLASSQSGSSLSTRPSPKHSPVYSSPKHNTASNSPKSPFGTHSPKHGSSGKPSMSTLKSATVASPKADKASAAAAAQAAPPVLSSSGLVRNLASTQSATPCSTSTSVASSSAAAMSVLKNKDKPTSTCTSPGTLPAQAASAGSSPSSTSAAASATAPATTAAPSPSPAAPGKTALGVSTMQQAKSAGNLNLLPSSSSATTTASSGFAATSAAPNSSLDVNTAMRKGGIAAADYVGKYM